MAKAIQVVKLTEEDFADTEKGGKRGWSPLYRASDIAIGSQFKFRPLVAQFKERKKISIPKELVGAPYWPKFYVDPDELSKVLSLRVGPAQDTLAETLSPSNVSTVFRTIIWRWLSETEGTPQCFEYGWQVHKDYWVNFDPSLGADKPAPGTKKRDYSWRGVGELSGRDFLITSFKEEGKKFQTYKAQICEPDETLDLTLELLQADKDRIADCEKEWRKIDTLAGIKAKLSEFSSVEEETDDSSSSFADGGAEEDDAAEGFNPFEGE